MNKKYHYLYGQNVLKSHHMRIIGSCIYLMEVNMLDCGVWVLKCREHCKNSIQGMIFCKGGK
jgi:hypothetical protein